MMRLITQRSFSKYRVGDKITITKTIFQEDVDKFIEISGDSNPIHITSDKQRAIVHGAYLNSLVSGVIGTKLPGPGALVVSQTLNFPNKCFLNDNVQITVELVENRKIITVKFQCHVVESNKVVLYGDARLIQNK